MKTKILISKTQLDKRIEELAKQIAHDYHGVHLVLIGVLDGSFIFLADFIRALWHAGFQDCEIEFIGISSYVGTESNREPQITKELKKNISGEHILIVEDIVDTGITMDLLQKLLQKRHPKSLKTLSLLSKPSRREIDVPIEYVGFEIENKWVIGYGFDTDGWGRGMNEVHEKID